MKNHSSVVRFFRSALSFPINFLNRIIGIGPYFYTYPATNQMRLIINMRYGVEESKRYIQTNQQRNRSQDNRNRLRNCNNDRNGKNRKKNV